MKTAPRNLLFAGLNSLSLLTFTLKLDCFDCDLSSEVKTTNQWRYPTEFLDTEVAELERI